MTRYKVAHLPDDHERVLITTIATLTRYGHPVPEQLQQELNLARTHIDALEDLRSRMSTRYAEPEHPAAVANWLIDQGWTPPPNTFHLEPAPEEDTP